jgi:hypothetical protein
MWQIMFFALPPQININAPNKHIKVKYYDRPNVLRYPNVMRSSKHIKNQKKYIKY